MKILDLFDKSRKITCRVERPYIIAEAGVNHEGSMKLAQKMIEDAFEGGAHAIKFQTYKAGSIASKNSPAYWDTEKEVIDSQYKLFQKYDKFWKTEYEQLKQYCDRVGIEFLSTPFDVESAKFLNELMDVFKISSSDITNKPFVEYLCEFGKPIILSTGASYLHEIQEAVEWIEAKQVPVALLHCILSYPTLDQDANLGMIKSLQQKFSDKLIGYSDHTLPGDMKNLEIATLLGAKILEKHFTHNKMLPGNDHYHAMDKEDLILFNSVIERDFSVLGKQEKMPITSEFSAINNARRSLVSSSDIAKGEVIMGDHLTWKRPGTGIQPKYIDDVIGLKAAVDIKCDDVIKWSMVM